MADDDAKIIEQRGYSKGYAAGLRRSKREVNIRAERAKRNAFMERAFLAALPFAFTQEHWSRGADKIASIDDRVRFAWEIAQAAEKRRPRSE